MQDSQQNSCYIVYSLKNERICKKVNLNSIQQSNILEPLQGQSYKICINNLDTTISNIHHLLYNQCIINIIQQGNTYSKVKYQFENQTYYLHHQVNNNTTSQEILQLIHQKFSDWDLGDMAVICNGKIIKNNMFINQYANQNDTLYIKCKSQHRRTITPQEYQAKFKNKRKINFKEATQILASEILNDNFSGTNTVSVIGKQGQDTQSRQQKDRDETVGKQQERDETAQKQSEGVKIKDQDENPQRQKKIEANKKQDIKMQQGQRELQQNGLQSKIQQQVDILDSRSLSTQPRKMQQRPKQFNINIKYGQSNHKLTIQLNDCIDDIMKKLNQKTGSNINYDQNCVLFNQKPLHQYDVVTDFPIFEGTHLQVVEISQIKNNFYDK